MKNWIVELCPEIAEWQADLIAEECEKRIAAAREPVDSNEKAGAYMDARLWEFVDMAAAWPQAKPDSRIWDHVLVYAPAAKQEPVAQGEPCGWFDPQTGDYSRVNRLGWSALYLHPAPEAKQEALLDSTVPPHALYYPLSDYHRAPAEGPLNFTWIDKPHRLLYDLIAAVKFYANPAPSVNAQLLEALRGMVDNFCWGDMNDGEHAAIEVARAAIAAAEVRRD